MDNLIKWLLTQALGTVKGAVVYDIYTMVKGGSILANTKASVQQVVLQWLCFQLLGTARGAEAYATITGVAGS